MSDTTLTQIVNDRRFEKWWKDASLRKLLAWQATILISQMTTGYDESVTGSFQSMAPWKADMGEPDASRIGLITAIVFVGGFVGAFIAPVIADRFGRRIGMLSGGSLTLIGTIIQTAAQNSSMFIASRFIIGLGISFTCVSGPSLLLELSRPEIRGTIASMFNVLWYVGSIVAAWTTFGTGYMTSSWSWRIPSLIQGIPALVVILSVLAGLPESPRWLCANGITEGARQILTEYHFYGDDGASLVNREIEEIHTVLEVEKQAKRTGQSSWSSIYRSPATRKRVALVTCVALLTIWNGQSVISYYFSPILDSVGITSTPQQTGVNGGLQIWNLICSLAGAVLADRIGRRPLWLISFSGMILANVPLTICSAVYAKQGSKPASYAVVVFLFLYDAAFNLANNPLLYCYPTEILPFTFRARGLGIQVAVSQAALTINQYINPIALAKIGFYYYIFYLGMLFLGTAIIYFTFPETKGKTEIELAAFFDDKADVMGIEGIEAGHVSPIDEKGPVIAEGRV